MELIRSKRPQLALHLLQHDLATLPLAHFGTMTQELRSTNLNAGYHHARPINVQLIKMPFPSITTTRYRSRQLSVYHLKTQSTLAEHKVSCSLNQYIKCHQQLLAN